MRRIDFRVFPITIVEFTEEVCFVSGFRPGIPKVHVDGARKSADLTSDSISLFSWEVLEQLEELYREAVGPIIELKFLAILSAYSLTSDI